MFAEAAAMVDISSASAVLYVYAAAVSGALGYVWFAWRKEIAELRAALKDASDAHLIDLREMIPVAKRAAARKRTRTP